jgi:UDP-GlcNAc:undecaprenyl-phosphate GlcNAc-1-phosphate transferase
MADDLLAVAIAAFGALSVTLASMAVLRPIARFVDLIDRPGGHKTHSGEVPVVGGLAMLLGTLFGLALTPGALGHLQFFVLSATLLVVVGMFDDRFNLSPSMRLVAQFIAVLPMVFGAGVSLRYFGDPFGTGDIAVDGLALPLTALFTMAAINAFNMLDGLDGLAGGLALVALLFIFPLGASQLGPVSLPLTAALAGAVLGFLCFNAPVQVNRTIRCFMGDAGSTLLGFALAWLCIDLTQHPSARVPPIVALWLVALPATDLLWTVVRRLSRGQSPLRADREHLHHSLLAAGLGVRAVFLVMVAAAFGFGMIGLTLVLMDVPDWLMLVLLFTGGAAFVVLCRNARVLLRFVPRGLRRGAQLPPAGVANDHAETV